ncbi:MAG: amidohydrolase, partial [Chloroflexi bacterium]|nr:amidohydrolase [Chloroflexota bacterium]
MPNLIESILYNGRIITLHADQPRVSALAISGGRVVALGSDDEILGLVGPTTRCEDLNGQCVIPGLTDAHIHWQRTAAALQHVDLVDVPTKAEALARVAAQAAATPAGEWVQGHGWAQGIWPDPAFPTAADLDAVAPDQPVYLSARSGHAAWANSLALKHAQIDADTPDPDGGQILRDASGAATGILLEPAAMKLVADAIPPLTTEQIAGQMQAAQQLALSLGLTGLHDFDDQTCLAALQLLRERDALRLRVVKNFNKRYLDSALDMGVRWGFGDDWLRIGGFKLFADGALGPLTALMIEPYDEQPDNFGMVVTPKAELLDLASRASAAGFPLTIHAIGDLAVRDVLDVYAQLRAQEAARGLTDLPRHRIEHVQLIHPDDVDRLAELQIIASMQPIHATSDYEVADRYWGDRVAWSYNPRLQLDRGVRVVFGS